MKLCDANAHGTGDSTLNTKHWAVNVEFNRDFPKDMEFECEISQSPCTHTHTYKSVVKALLPAGWFK